MSEQVENKTPQHVVISRNDDMHLVDLLLPLARQKKIVIGFPVVSACVMLAISFVLKPVYMSSAVIMPPQQQSSGVAAMLGQLGGLAGAAGSIAGLKNPNDLYVGMLRARTLEDNLIADFKLKERYEEKTMDETRRALEKVSSVQSGKDGLITVSVEDHDPQFAADLANAYIRELSKLTQSLAITEAAQRRMFFEKQLKKSKDELADAEIAMRNMQQSTGMLQLDGQVKGIIANTAQLQGTIAAKEVQLKAIRSYATMDNPDVRKLQEELRGLNAELLKLQKGQSAEGDLMVPTGKIPEIGLNYIRSVRDVKYYETIYELLAKQYELARIDEAKESSIIQQLDKAVPAEKKSKPKRLILILAAFFGGGFFGIFIALMRDGYLRARENKSDSRWQELSKAWRS